MAVVATGILAESYGKSSLFEFALIDSLEECASEETLFASNKNSCENPIHSLLNVIDGSLPIWPKIHKRWFGLKSH